MTEITIKKEHFEEAIKAAFKKGENWGVTYSTWFTPSEEDTKDKIEECIKRCKDIVRIPD